MEEGRGGKRNTFIYMNTLEPIANNIINKVKR